MRLRFVDVSCASCGGTYRIPSGESLRAARLAEGLTLAEMAERVGVTPSAICHYERGRRRASPEVAAGYRTSTRPARREHREAAG